MDRRFVTLPEPPYYAVIFRRKTDADDGYDAMADAVRLAAGNRYLVLNLLEIPGHSELPSPIGVTSRVSLRGRRKRHTLAQERGKADWYSHCAASPG